VIALLLASLALSQSLQSEQTGLKRCHKQGEMSKDAPPRMRCCQLKDGWSCYLFALQHYKGLGVDKNYEIAASAAGAGCTRGVTASCKLKAKAQKKADKQ